MTTELEQEFFNTFGIEPKIEKYCYWECKKPELKDVACESPCNFNITNIFYPEITDKILLELICVAYKTQDIELTVEDIKNEVINNCIKYKDDIKRQIQQLFKENQ